MQRQLGCVCVLAGEKREVVGGLCSQACAVACICRGKSCPWARCWWQSKSWQRASKSSRRRDALQVWECRRRDKEVEKKDTGGSVITKLRRWPHLSSPPLTFTVWHLTPKEHLQMTKKISPFSSAILSSPAPRPPKSITLATQIEYYSTSYQPFGQIPFSLFHIFFLFAWFSLLCSFMQHANCCVANSWWINH